MVVEDSQRKSSRLAMHNATPSLVAQLIPGQVLTLVNPYVWISGDKSILLRVDDPSGAMKLKEKHTIC